MNCIWNSLKPAPKSWQLQCYVFIIFIFPERKRCRLNNLLYLTCKGRFLFNFFFPHLFQFLVNSKFSYHVYLLLSNSVWYFFFFLHRKWAFPFKPQFSDWGFFGSLHLSAIFSVFSSFPVSLIVKNKFLFYFVHINNLFFLLYFYFHFCFLF